MAKVLGPFLSFHATGNIGKSLTAKQWKGIKQVIRYSKPSGPPSAAQTSQRLRVHNAMLSWRKYLHPTDAGTAWNLLAKSIRPHIWGYNHALKSLIPQLAADPDASYAISIEEKGTGKVYVEMQNMDDGTTGDEFGLFDIWSGSDPRALYKIGSNAIVTGNVATPSLGSSGDTVYFRLIKSYWRSGIYKITLLYPEIVLDLMEYANDAAAQAAWVSSNPNWLIQKAQYTCEDDAASTAILDSSGNDNDAALGGGDNTEDISQNPGKIGKSLKVNGSDDYFNMDAVVSDITASTTGAIALWLKPTNAAATWKGICSFADTDANTNIMFRQSDSNGKLYVTLDLAGTRHWGFRTTSAVVFTATWGHVVLRHNGTTPSLWVNNVSVPLTWINVGDKTKWFADCPGIDNARIGCNNFNSGGNGSFWAGEVDDVRIFSENLTDAELTAIYNAGSGTESILYPVLQCYSESTIKTQGSYSLKGVAAITDSLNKTLSHTIDPPLDLSGMDHITFDVRSIRTIQPLRGKLWNSTGESVLLGFAVTASETWQNKIIDISASPDSDKDSINKISFEVINADTANTFYIDNMYAY